MSTFSCSIACPKSRAVRILTTLWCCASISFQFAVYVRPSQLLECARGRPSNSVFRGGIFVNQGRPFQQPANKSNPAALATMFPTLYTTVGDSFCCVLSALASAMGRVRDDPTSASSWSPPRCWW